MRSSDNLRTVSWDGNPLEVMVDLYSLVDFILKMNDTFLK